MPELSLQFLTLVRAGRVSWGVSGPYHCGPKSLLREGPLGPTLDLEYRVVLECGLTLDDRGFLFDQIDVNAWMQAQACRDTELSCERRAIEVGARLVAEIQRHAPTCALRRLTLELWPAPGIAGMVAVWAAG